jgi:hypothetical protein
VFSEICVYIYICVCVLCLGSMELNDPIIITLLQSNKFAANCGSKRGEKLETYWKRMMLSQTYNVWSVQLQSTTYEDIYI